MSGLLDWLLHPIDSSQAAWEDAVIRWKNAVIEFDAEVSRHIENRYLAVQMGELDEWQAQLNRALGVQTAIETLQEQLQNASNWYSKTFGMSGLSGPELALVPIAVITGSISAVVAITYALYTYNNQLQAKWDYINANDISPEQVPNILDSNGGDLVPGMSNSIDKISNIAMWIVIGGLLLKFGPVLIKQGKGGK